MNIQDEERWKEQDFRNFQQFEYERTTKAHEPIPEGAVLKTDDLSTERDIYLCIDCGRSFGPNAEARDKHFMSPDCPQQGRYDREGTILNDE